MTVKSQRCILLLLNAVAGMLSVSGTVTYVCPGDNLQAFQNIDFDPCDAHVSLKVNGEKNTEIVNWSSQNCTLSQSFVLTEYQGRVFLHPNGTLTIHELHHFDQGKYIVTSEKDALPSLQEIEIKVMDAPSMDCKPLIVRHGGKLFVSVKANLCGRPVVTTYWKGYDGIPVSDEPMLKIAPGNTDRKYEACIKGPALQCAHSLTNHCESVIIERDVQDTMSTSSCSSNGFVAGIAVLGFCLMLAIFAIVILVIKLRTYISLLDYSKKLLNDDQRQDLEIYLKSLRLGDSCYTEKVRSVCKGERQGVRIPLETSIKMKEIESEERPFIDDEKNKELQELRDADRCKICFVNKRNAFFMPCSHLATCESCSLPLETCPVCRAKIEEKMNISF